MKSINIECGVDSIIEYLKYESIHLVPKYYCKIYANHRTSGWNEGHTKAG